MGDAYVVPSPDTTSMQSSRFICNTIISIFDMVVTSDGVTDLLFGECHENILTITRLLHSYSLLFVAHSHRSDAASALHIPSLL